MTNFGAYADYYDLLYADKDYLGEAKFVQTIIKRHSPLAGSVLELGCGSGRHAVELARKGFDVTGVDRSAQMIARGYRHIEELAPDLRRNIRLVHGDATKFAPTRSYDVVTALFHVINYQTTNEALAATFQTARKAIAPDGIMIFDFWYGPAVLEQKPEVRIKRVATETQRVVRLAEPKLDAGRNLVEVKYTLIVIDRKSGRAEEIEEVHILRYLFYPEIEILVAAAGFDVVEVGEWLTGHELTPQSWSGYVAVRPIAVRT